MAKKWKGVVISAGDSQAQARSVEASCLRGRTTEGFSKCSATSAQAAAFTLWRLKDGKATERLRIRDLLS